jgi:hypothetical protein
MYCNITMLSQLTLRVIIAPLVFLTFSYLIYFFIRKLGINDSIFWIIVVMISVPIALYIIIGS